ncbi:hypothetical protein [uncultured Methanolobus sp.]|nr:hypothetical protein [uncultured Methanolobus sp.]
MNSALLTSIATAIDGQYFPVSSADDLPRFSKPFPENWNQMTLTRMVFLT